MGCCEILLPALPDGTSVALTPQFREAKHICVRVCVSELAVCDLCIPFVSRIQLVCSNQPPGGGADPAAGPALLRSADCPGHHPPSGRFSHRKPKRGKKKAPNSIFLHVFYSRDSPQTISNDFCLFFLTSSDVVSLFERNPPAPPTGRRQLPTPPPPASLRPPRRSPNEALGPDPQSPLPAEPAAVGRRPLHPAGVPHHADDLVLSRGGTQSAGAPEARHTGSVAAAGGGVSPAASSSAPACRVHASPTLRSPRSASGHSPCHCPLKQPLSGLHLPHAGLEHLPF